MSELDFIDAALLWQCVGVAVVVMGLVGVIIAGIFFYM